MTLLIGTDEAGYGPNLGPLVVAATAWRIAAAADDAEEVLARAIGAIDALRFSHHGGARTPLWADSKRVYRAAAGLAGLEQGVGVGLLLAGGAMPGTWTDLEHALGPISPPDGCRGEWRRLTELTLPLAAPPTATLDLAEAARDLLARHGVTLVRIACRCIYPGSFNASLDDGLNKSDILSAATLDLAASLHDDGPLEPAIVWCDRHGGRKRYGGLVARHFRIALVQPLEETPVRSAYQVPAREHPATAGCRIEFCVGGESRAPVALASMAAKYVRELAMQAFNAFWSARLPGLAPTAGYPVDALRWRQEAAPAIAAEAIRDDALWRRA